MDDAGLAKQGGTAGTAIENGFSSLFQGAEAVFL